MSGNGQSINWEEVKKKLQAAQLGLDKALTADPERTEAVYRQRAAQLAGRRSQFSGGAAVQRVLVFSLGAERYAIEMGDLVEMFPFGDCTPIPGAPAQLLGVTNVHGEIRSVVDLGRLLDLPEHEASGAPGYVVLIRRQGREVGLRVDSVDDIQQLPPEPLATPEDGEGGPSLHYLKGLTPDRLRVLNTEALFAHPIFQKRTV